MSRTLRHGSRFAAKLMQTCPAAIRSLNAIVLVPFALLPVFAFRHRASLQRINARPNCCSC